MIRGARLGASVSICEAPQHAARARAALVVYTWVCDVVGLLSSIVDGVARELALTIGTSHRAAGR